MLKGIIHITYYYYEIGLSEGGTASEFKVTTSSSASNPLSTTKGDWKNNNDFDIIDITFYRKYLAGEGDSGYSGFDASHKKALNYDNNTTISLVDLIQARIALANK